MSAINSTTGVQPVLFDRNLLSEHGSQLVTEIKSINKLRSLESQNAYKQAVSLHEIAKSFNDYVCDAPIRLNRPVPLIQVIQETEIPMNIPNRLIELLANDDVQTYNELKLMICRTARIFLELVVYQFHAEHRRAYDTTVAKLTHQLETVRKALPDNQFELAFELDCCLSALKKLDRGIGNWKQLGRDQITPFTKAILEGVLLRNPSTLVSPIINLSIAIYNTMEDSWYKPVWGLRWYAAERRITSLEQFQRCQQSFEFHKFRKHERQAFYLNLLFTDIIENAKADPQLKEHVMNQELTISTEFWSIRYTTIKRLSQIIRSANLTAALINSMASLMLRTWGREVDSENKTALGVACLDAHVKLAPMLGSIDFASDKTQVVQYQRQKLNEIEEKKKHLRFIERSKEAYHKMKAKIAHGENQDDTGIEYSPEAIEGQIAEFEQEEKNIQTVLEQLTQEEINAKTEIENWETLEKIKEGESWDLLLAEG